MVAERFVLSEATQALAGTPAVLRALLSELPESWLHANEGPDTWSPFDVVGHLIHGEKTDWIPRTRHILGGSAATPFTPFDRFAQFQESEGKTLKELLDEFEDLRRKNLDELRSLGLGDAELDLEGLHPEFGTVTLRQLLATWVCHDFSHLGQMARLLAKRHQEAVGPWAQYLSILHR
jgi:uncharacterized damage-inducible protein DinB